MRSIIIGFGLLICCLLVLFKIAEVNFMRGDVKLEVVVAIAAILFFFAGLYINGQQQKKQATGQAAPPEEKNTPTAPSAIDYAQIKKLGLTQREHEVLVKMAEGLSNLEIAGQLFLSESTIKTHVSNIFFKLEVKRRTQAVQVARELGIVG
jgi:DNA-binding NarL/FixJ family response regulator